MKFCELFEKLFEPEVLFVDCNYLFALKLLKLLFFNT